MLARPERVQGSAQTPGSAGASCEVAGTRGIWGDGHAFARDATGPPRAPDGARLDRGPAVRATNNRQGRPSPRRERASRAQPGLMDVPSPQPRARHGRARARRARQPTTDGVQPGAPGGSSSARRATATPTARRRAPVWERGAISPAARTTSSDAAGSMANDAARFGGSASGRVPAVRVGP
jgi:hypothetical protein